MSIQSPRSRVQCLVIALSLAACAAHAATRTWMAGGDGVWANPANWEDGLPPGGNDTADLSAASGVVTLAADASVAGLVYAPVFSGATNTLTILSDTAAPDSRTLALTNPAENIVTVGEGAELLFELDATAATNVVKNGAGDWVLQRRLTTVSRVLFYLEEGRLVNAGTLASSNIRFVVGSVDGTGTVPEFINREGAVFETTDSTKHNDIILGNHRQAQVPGIRGRATQEGGTIDLTRNLTGGAFLLGSAGQSDTLYTLAGGELNLAGKKAFIGMSGTGTLNQTGGRLAVTDVAVANAGTGYGVYDLAGGELRLGGLVERPTNGGTPSFRLGGGAVWPFNRGFTIHGSAGIQFTGINGPTRFCSDGGAFTNLFGSVAGAGGFVKEGADTLTFSGSQSFTGPVIVSNGTVNITQIGFSGGNAVTVAGGELNLDAPVLLGFNTLTIAGGTLRAASNTFAFAKALDPWVDVRGTGTLRLLAGADGLFGVNVSEAGHVDVRGGMARVYRLQQNGIEWPAGYYTAAECPAVTGDGVLAVRLLRGGIPLADGFDRADGIVPEDSLGQTEVGRADWLECRPLRAWPAPFGNIASVTNGELRLGTGNSDPVTALTAASWPNAMASTRMRFQRVEGSGATLKNGCGLLLRRSLCAGFDWTGTVYVIMTASGGLFIRENFDGTTKYAKNPFTGSGSYLSYGAAGSLPVTVGGAPFDADGDGRLGADEPFELTVLLYGKRFQVLVNGEPVAAVNLTAEADAAADNTAGLLKNRLSGANAESHDTYHDTFAVTNVPWLVRHIGAYDPNIAAALPREHWTLGGNTNVCPVGPVQETVGGESVAAWRIEDPSTAGGSVAHYIMSLTDAECALADTNRWRLVMRLRVPNAGDACDDSVYGEVSSATKRFIVRFGSDAAGNALVRLNNGTIRTVTGGNVYHTYVVEYDPASASVSLTCDGNLLETGTAGMGTGYKRVLWGANASGTTGCAHYQDVRFEMAWPEPPLPPEPPQPPAPRGTVVLVK